MIYVLKTKLPEKKPIVKALCFIYGIGHSTSTLICKKLGFLPTFKIQNMSPRQNYKLTKFMEQHASDLVLDKDLKKLENKDKNRLTSIKSYRGTRINKGLPVRGQRTHSNAQTAARFVDRYQRQQKSVHKKQKKIKKKNYSI